MGKIKIVNIVHVKKVAYIHDLLDGECFIQDHAEDHPSADVYMKHGYNGYKSNCISLSGGNFCTIDVSTKLIKVNPTLTYTKEFND